MQSTFRLKATLSCINSLNITEAEEDRGRRIRDKYNKGELTVINSAADIFGAEASELDDKSRKEKK